jgi:hypothetical protein
LIPALSGAYFLLFAQHTDRGLRVIRLFDRSLL